MESSKDTNSLGLSVLLTCNFLLTVVIVAGGQEVSEDHGRHVHLLCLVFHHRDALTVVPHLDPAVLTATKDSALHFSRTVVTNKRNSNPQLKRNETMPVVCTSHFNLSPPQSYYRHDS